MSFLQPIVLLGMVLAAIPILIHLLNLMRHRRESWAAMMFLLKAKKSTSRLSKIRKWLALLFRVLAIGSLVILMARPISNDDGNFITISAQSPELILLVLDRSASMARKNNSYTKSHMQTSIEDFQKFAKIWPEARLAVIESVFSKTIILDNIDMLYTTEMRDFFGPTDTSSNLPYTINRGLTWLKDAGIGEAHIIIASDYQSACWDIPNNDPLVRKINQRIESKNGMWQMHFLNREKSKNINYSLHAKSVIQEKRFLYPTLSIQGNEDTSRNLGIKININGQVMPAECEFSYPATTWTPIVPIPESPSKGWVQVTLPEDTSSHDNNYYFTYGNTQLLKVGMLVNKQQVKKVLSASITLNPDKVIIRNELFESKKQILDYDLIFVQGEQNSNTRELLDAFVKKGGNIVLFPDKSDGRKKQILQNWSPLEISTENNNFTITEWNKNGGILANTANGKELPLSFIKVKQRRVPQEGLPLAYYRDGKTFLSRKTIGQGMVYSFSSMPSDDWSSLSDGFVLVPAMLRILDECRASSIKVSLDCGSTKSRDLTDLISLTGNKSDKPFLHAGIYKKLGSLTAINQPSIEYQSKELKQSELQELLTSQFIKWSESKALNFSNKKTEIWDLFLILMIAFLLIESLLSLPFHKPKLTFRNVS